MKEEKKINRKTMKLYQQWVRYSGLPPEEVPKIPRRKRFPVLLLIYIVFVMIYLAGVIYVIHHYLGDITSIIPHTW